MIAGLLRVCQIIAKFIAPSVDLTPCDQQEHRSDTGAGKCQPRHPLWPRKVGCGSPHIPEREGSC